MKKRNDCGFSLVELIIVIAIMATLVGILAPQYMKYVEKTEKTRDCSAISVVLDACEVIALDPDIAWNDTLEITMSSTGISYSGGVATEMSEYVPNANAKLKSTTWGPFTIEATKGVDGRVTFNIADADKNLINKYSPDLAERLE